MDRAVLQNACAAEHLSGPGAVWFTKPQVDVGRITVTRDADTEGCILMVDKGPATIRLYVRPDELRAFLDNMRAFLDHLQRAAPPLG